MGAGAYPAPMRTLISQLLRPRWSVTSYRWVFFGEEPEILNIDRRTYWLRFRATRAMRSLQRSERLRRDAYENAAPGVFDLLPRFTFAVNRA